MQDFIQARLKDSITIESDLTDTECSFRLQTEITGKELAEAMRLAVSVFSKGCAELHEKTNEFAGRRQPPLRSVTLTAGWPKFAQTKLQLEPGGEPEACVVGTSSIYPTGSMILLINDRPLIKFEQVYPVGTALRTVHGKWKNYPSKQRFRGLAEEDLGVFKHSLRRILRLWLEVVLNMRK